MIPNPLAPTWLTPPDDANTLPAQVWSHNAMRDSDGQLQVGGVTASHLVEHFGTPVFVVDQSDVTARARGIRESFDQEFARVGSSAKVYYASKAFLCTQIARWVTDAGLYIDVATGGELMVALAAGVDPARLGFHGNNKSLAEIDHAVSIGVSAIVIDSVVEVEAVASAAARHGVTQAVRLRINSGVHASTHEYLATAREDQKFGVPLTDAIAVVDVIRAEPALKFIGLHSHFGSQIFESDGFAEAAKRLLTIHAELLQGGPVSELNLGGGFGIAYNSADDPLELDEVARRLAEIVSACAAELGIPVPIIAVEPGRAVVGPSTTTLYRVGTVKDVIVNGGAIRKYVSVDGGMSDNIRPALYGANYSARIANRESNAEAALVRVVGKHCESGDIVVHAEYLPGDVKSGDVLAVPATGAYGWAMASNYNYVPRPPVVAVVAGVARLIVRGETDADLLSRDIGVQP